MQRVEAFGSPLDLAESLPRVGGVRLHVSDRLAVFAFEVANQEGTLQSALERLRIRL